MSVVNGQWHLIINYESQHLEKEWEKIGNGYQWQLQEREYMISAARSAIRSGKLDSSIIFYLYILLPIFKIMNEEAVVKLLEELNIVEYESGLSDYQKGVKKTLMWLYYNEEKPIVK